ncbi:hypothetical protein [Thermobifida fusca]|uniref:hypothetical protein n=1 Tax=Thermobifida fusca TaxID=2021 RepID=UPI00187879F6|nr:hypothetical protein [Thermobifida fusca]QOS58634.1 hypothetical protein IM867_15005 [Thermobifida fusca]
MERNVAEVVELAISELRETIGEGDRGLYVVRRPGDEFDAYFMDAALLRRPADPDEVNSEAVRLLFMIFTLLYLDIKRYPEREKDRYAKRIGLGEGFDEQRFRALGLGVKLDDPIQFVITRDPKALTSE